jgi:hypothetical protein
MTIWGVLIFDGLGLALLVWLGNLIRRGRLYVGYGAILLLSIIAVMVIVSFPPLERFLINALESVFPSSAVVIMTFGYLFLMIIYLLTQVTLLSDRLAALIQDIAIRETQPEHHRIDPLPLPSSDSQSLDKF